MKKILKLYTNLITFYLGIFIIVLASVINISIPIFVKKLLESEQIKSGIITLAGVILTSTLLLALANYVISKNGEDAILKLKEDTSQHLIDSPVEFFENEKSGGLTHKLMDSFDEIRNFISTTIPNFISSVIIVIGSIIVLLILDWKLSLVLISSLVILIVLLSIFSNLSTNFSKILKVNQGNLSGKLAEFFQQIRLIKFSNAQNFVKTKIDKELKTNYKASLKLALVDSFVQPLVMLFLIVVIIGIFSYGAIRIQDGNLTVSVLIAFLIYLFQLLTPFSQIGQFFNTLAKVKVSLDFIDSINTNKSELEMEKDLQHIDIPRAEILNLDNISFSYGEKNVLHNISIVARRGEKIALVGPSGSGKSTILKLIQKLYHNYDGQINLNGINTNNFGIIKWRNILSVVDQDTALLSISIRENLLLGVTGKSQKQLEEALEKASLFKDIKDLPHGIDTEIGEGGIKLSGGQKQRLQIARAFLKDSPILLMDEPTANLDSETEKIITDSMTELAKDKISIIVAHRLSTIVDSDSIYFVENGKITGYGTHQELLTSHPKYKKFVEEQIIN